MKRRLNELVRQVRLELDNFKISSYKAYLSEVNQNDSSLWQATKRVLRTPTIIPPLKEGNSCFQSDEEKCKAFCRVL